MVRMQDCALLGGAGMWALVRGALAAAAALPPPPPLRWAHAAADRDAAPRAAAAYLHTLLASGAFSPARLAAGGRSAAAAVPALADRVAAPETRKACLQGVDATGGTSTRAAARPPPTVRRSCSCTIALQSFVEPLASCTCWHE